MEHFAEWYATITEIDDRPILGDCCVCGQEIRGASRTQDGDDAYQIDGDFVCFDCLREYAERWRLSNE